MNAQPQDFPESSLSGYSQNSHAMLRNICEQPQAMRGTYHLARLNGCNLGHQRHLVKAVVRE